MEKLKLPVVCPQCGSKNNIRVEEMVPGRTRSCTACSLVFKFSGSDGRGAQRALDDLTRTIKNAFK